MSVFAYVDFSNLYIEAKHVAAHRLHEDLSINEIMDRNMMSPWACDFQNLFNYIGGKEMARALLVTSDPFNAVLPAQLAGFEVKTFPKSSRGREKRVDVHLATQAVKDALSQMDSSQDEVIIVSGDLDQEPPVTLLKSYGFKVSVMFWDHAAKELRNAADTFYSLNSQWDLITWRV